MSDHYIYDLETYPNVFLCCIKDTKNDEFRVYELSERVNHMAQLIDFLDYLKDINAVMVGYNNLGFDYPIIHMIKSIGPTITCDVIYKKATSIINHEFADPFAHRIAPWGILIPQMDLMAIVGKVSLKKLEFAMKMETIEGLPFDPTVDLPAKDIPSLIKYNEHDVEATELFYQHIMPQIKQREHLTEISGIDHSNMSDVAIGTKFLERQLIKAGIETRTDGKPIQTHRFPLKLSECVFPWIKFKNREFQEILDIFHGATITETKSIFDDLTAFVGGLEFKFGTGGLHASVSNKIISADDEYSIGDLDVTSYYPSLAIENGLHPEHLTDKFCEVYTKLREKRLTYDKGTPENTSLKFALNGSYGNSNYQHSIFYDPKFTMAITLNGQLLLCLLIEKLLLIDGLKLIQVNTDGLSFKYLTKDLKNVQTVVTAWEAQTSLCLEYNEYKKMFIRDVNSYIAVNNEGGIKRVGAYKSKRDWKANHNALCVSIASEDYLLNGTDIKASLEALAASEPHSFCLLTNIPRNGRGECGGEPIPNLSRYYISNSGGELHKFLPALPKKVAVGDNSEREFYIHRGYGATICNEFNPNDIMDINFNYYIKEVQKLAMILERER